MFTNFIGIDPSLTCSAVFINGEVIVFANESISDTSKGKKTKWFDLFTEHGSLVTYSLGKNKVFTDQEVIKLIDFDRITNEILDNIKERLIPNGPSICYIEGYSYSSAAGPLIDLVTFSTLLRKKLIESGIDIVIIPPQQLKKRVCEMVYGKHKKQCKNSEGVSGGNFKKHEMFRAITEHVIKNEWTSFLESISEGVYDSKKIPKPIEDANDAYLLYQLTIEDHYKL